MRTYLVAGNWKMNGSKQQVQEMVSNLSEGLTGISTEQVQAVICPPYVYLDKANQDLSSATKIKLGAQDSSAFDDGAYTGQVSTPMLKELGCEYIILGHSERRQYCHDDDSLIADKFNKVKDAGLIPILCVGESLSEYESGKTKDVVLGQLQKLLSQSPDVFKGAVIAYEPIWAIGTGKTATPEQAQEVHRYIRQQVAKSSQEVAAKVQILYGGSVKADNAASLFAMSDVDGALVGGACLDPIAFLGICQGAKEVYSRS